MVQPEARHWGHKPPTRLGKMEQQGHPQKAWSKGGPWGAPGQGQRTRLECRPSHSLPTLRSRGSFLWTQERLQRVPQVGRLAGLAQGGHTAGSSACRCVPCPVELGPGLLSCSAAPLQASTQWDTPFWDGVKTGTLKSAQPGPGPVFWGRGTGSPTFPSPPPQFQLRRHPPLGLRDAPHLPLAGGPWGCG